MSPESIRLTLPYPPSGNRYWRSTVIKGHVSVYLSAEAKKYKRAVALACKLADVRRPITGRVAVSLVLHPHRPLDARQRMRKFGDAWDVALRSIDLDNSAKIAIDALQGYAFTDDALVWRLVAERGEPLPEAQLVVTIEPIVFDVPQYSLFADEPRQPVPDPLS